MSAEEVYAHASPAVVKLRIYNNSRFDDEFLIATGSGFILADRFTKPVRVDQEEKYFAGAKDYKHRGAFYQRWKASMEPSASSAGKNKPVPLEGEEFRKAREQAFEQDCPGLQQAFIVTNYHVIEAAAGIQIKMYDGTAGFVSEVIQEDEAADLAILLGWVPGAKPPATIALSRVPPNVGAKVYAIGSPLGLENTLSEGLVSGIREKEDGRRVSQTSAAISPGSSGGPLLAANGKVVGIAKSIRVGGQNLNFAVPAADVLRLLDKPPKPREVWRGRSVFDEENFARENAWAVLNCRKDAAAAKALQDEDLLNVFSGSNELLLKEMKLKSVDEAEDMIVKAIQTVPREFKYLAFFYGAKFQQNQAFWLKSEMDTQADRGVPIDDAKREEAKTYRTAALMAFQKVAELKPDFAPAFLELCRSHGALENWADARRAADRLVAPCAALC